MSSGELADATIVFDLDGTLVDTAPDLVRALNETMDLEGLPRVKADRGGVHFEGGFADGTEGPVIICADDVGAAPLIDQFPQAHSYGESGLADFVISDVDATDGMRWTLTDPDGVEHHLSLPLPGRHLVLNATAAFALAVSIGADPVGAAAGIARYRGVGRRFEIQGDASHNVGALIDSLGDSLRELRSPGIPRLAAGEAAVRISRSEQLVMGRRPAFCGYLIVTGRD